MALALLVPGLLMGGKEAAAGGGATARLLPLVGVGKSWWWIVLPTLLAIGV